MKKLVLLTLCILTFGSAISDAKPSKASKDRKPSSDLEELDGEQAKMMWYTLHAIFNSGGKVHRNSSGDTDYYVTTAKDGYGVQHGMVNCVHYRSEDRYMCKIGRVSYSEVKW